MRISTKYSMIILCQFLLSFQLLTFPFNGRVYLCFFSISTNRPIYRLSFNPYFFAFFKISISLESQKAIMQVFLIVCKKWRFHQEMWRTFEKLCYEISLLFSKNSFLNWKYDIYYGKKLLIAIFTIKLHILRRKHWSYVFRVTLPLHLLRRFGQNC